MVVRQPILFWRELVFLMNVNANIFRAYDVRGVIGRDLTDEVVEAIGRAVCSGKRVCVGYDVRDSSKRFADVLVRGLVSAGNEVLFVDEFANMGVPLFAGMSEGVDVTLFVTASHLPADWNGVKLYEGDGNGFQQERIERLRDDVLNDRFFSALLQVEIFVLPCYQPLLQYEPLRFQACIFARLPVFE